MILDTIASFTRNRVREAKERVPLETIKELAYNLLEQEKESGRSAFENVLKKPGLSFICEIKRASPSKGLIAPCFPYVGIAKEYEEEGAAAISVLTEPKFFRGENRYLKEISQAVRIPLLRKDFVIDEYQIYEAKCLGASAVLLICSLLNNEKLEHFMKLCRELELGQLVEAHRDQEVDRAVRAGASVIGINNRNLETFEVDFSNALHLRNLVGKETIFVAESGIQGSEDIKALADAKVDAVLIGEALMRAEDRKEMLRKFRKAAEGN